MKRVVYIARATVPSKSTNSVHIAKISEGFTELTDSFSLIVSGSDKSISAAEYYGLNHDFEIIELKEKGKDRLSQIKWANAAVKMAIKSGADRIVTRDPFTAFFAVMKGTEATLDLHGDLNHLCGRFYRMIKWGPFVNNKKLKLVMISEGLKDYYVKKYGVSPDRITVLPDACTLSDYEGISDKPSGNFGERLQIGYFGKTLIGKGIDLIRRLAALDPDNDYEIYGDTKEAAEKETGKSFSDNVHFHGHVRNAEIPAIMCSMDVLLLPNQDKVMVMGEDIGKFTSPLKLFEYMASGRVIIASDLPVIREVVDDNIAYLADSADETEWKKALDSIKANPMEAAQKAEAAKEKVKQYTWIGRAGKML